MIYNYQNANNYIQGGFGDVAGDLHLYQHPMRDSQNASILGEKRQGSDNPNLRNEDSSTIRDESIYYP